MTIAQIKEAFNRCIHIGDDGYFDCQCHGCPMVDDEWKDNGYAACRSYAELSVDIPYDLAIAALEALCGKDDSNAKQGAETPSNEE